MTVLQSYLAGQWFGSQAAKPLASAINGEIVAHTHDDAPDFAAAVDYARTTGTRELLKLDFQERAARLKAMALYLQEHKKELYTLSRHTGATKGDNAFDIDGGFGTLFAYASMGRKELPSGNVLHEGPVVPLGKENHFAATHILVPRRGVAVHIKRIFRRYDEERFVPAVRRGFPQKRDQGVQVRAKDLEEEEAQE